MKTIFYCKNCQKILLRKRKTGCCKKCSFILKVGGRNGKLASLKTRHKQSLARLGWNPSKVTREKMRQNNLGKKQSEAQKIKARAYRHNIQAIEKIKIARHNQIFPNKDTNIEILLQNELTKKNILFKKHVPLIGQPDIFIEPNICIFCDGDYWHANPSKYYSSNVIFSNIIAKDIWKKDWNVTRKLTEQNYFVIRFWETDILKDVKLIGDRIENLLK